MGIRALSLLFVLLSAADARAQEPTLCGQTVPPPASLPPAGSPPVVFMIGLCFDAQGNTSAIDPETYLFHIQLRPSRPSQDEWVPYDEAVLETVRADFQRLWETGFLDDLRIEADDYHFANGVVGKLITYHMEERERIRAVAFSGSDVVSRTDIDERLRERGLELRLDSFLDRGRLARARSVVRELLVERGYADADVGVKVNEVAGGPKLVRLDFVITQGPRIAIRDVEFVGNAAIADRALETTLKANRPQSLLSVLRGTGRYNAEKYAEDAQEVVDYYRDRGYVDVRVGEPELRPLDASSDSSTRWVQLRIPVSEGRRYRLGTLSFDGNQIVAGDVLRTLFKTAEGDWYSQRVFREGLQKAREIYGAAGYIEFVGRPDVVPRDDEGDIVDVTLRVTEGPQYTINRITFSGNTITRDNVIRREIALIEGGIFNTEALKYSVRRLNQLGYFKPLEGTPSDVNVEKAAGSASAVDLTFTLEEQNRNQVQFGAGASQYEGIFGNLSYTTSNFLGRGETFTLAAQKGARSSVYQLGFTEPYVFDRPITAGIDLFSRKVDFLTGVETVGYSEVRSGMSVTVGRSLFRFSRLFLSYGYEVVDTAISNDLLDELDAEGSVGVPVFTPFLDEGRHVESRVSPSFVHNTVDNPFMPRSGRKLTVSLPVAGGLFGGTTHYVKPEIEAVWYVAHTRRTSLGLRANGGMVRAYGRSGTLPYYLRYFLGGEYQIRGVDIRTVGPTDSQNRSLGGNRFVLFNAEYYLDLFASVRALVFHDAGQAYAEDEPLDLRQLRTSSGVELRVIVPMINVPFRLIYAWNTYRDTFQKPRTFRFAVGTTF